MSTAYVSNRRDAFSHSAQCDAFLSVLCDPYVPGGVPHISCKCWCHNAQHLFSSPEPEYDLTPPPEWATSADLAFSNALPIVPYNNSVVVDDTGAAQIFAPESEPEWENRELTRSAPNMARYPDRSRRELQTGKCDTCGDTLAACECVT